MRTWCERRTKPYKLLKLCINVEVSYAAREVKVPRTEQVLELAAKSTLMRNFKVD